MVKYVGAATRQEYLTIEQAKELQAHFHKRAHLWASGLDSPSIAERVCYWLCKDVISTNYDVPPYTKGAPPNGA